MTLHDADIDQGGWRAADGPTHQLAVLREGFDRMILDDSGRDQGGWRNDFVQNYFSYAPLNLANH